MKAKKQQLPAQLLPNGKKALTTAVVNREFRDQKNPVAEYIGVFFWICAIIAFAYFFNPVCFLFLLAYPFILAKDIRKDIRRKNLKYSMIERPCIEKCLAEHDEDPDEWQLWFYNAEGDWRVAISVEKDYYDATQVGESFYLVFAQGERTPCLWYRTSEWEIAGDGWKS